MTTERPPAPGRGLALGRALVDRSTWLLPLAVVAGAAVLGALRGAGAAILVLAGGALLGVIALLWRALQVLLGESPLSLEAALDLSAATAADEQKQAVLRALKDLEYERGLGKLSDEDYRELAARYRAEAKAVMRSIDDSLGPARLRAERLIEDRLGQKAAEKPKKKKKRAAAADAPAADGATAAPAADADAPSPAAPDEDVPAEPAAEASPADAPGPAEAAAVTKAGEPRDVDAPAAAAAAPALVVPPAAAEAAAPPAEPRDEKPAEAGASAPAEAKAACPACSTRNDADAAFCKACGARMRPAPAASPEP
ncbi:MAG TPA: zinc ribbon domain-containing protein [Polyangiaceae bacterium]|nr:zinc ribbon domain-containing protein [Polyangiaceae bacterium]